MLQYYEAQSCTEGIWKSECSLCKFCLSVHDSFVSGIILRRQDTDALHLRTEQS